MNGPGALEPEAWVVEFPGMQLSTFETQIEPGPAQCRLRMDSNNNLPRTEIKQFLRVREIVRGENRHYRTIDLGNIWGVMKPWPNGPGWLDCIRRR